MEFDIELIRRYAAENRIKFGRASSKAVIGKVIASKPEYRARIKELIRVIEEVVDEINSMSLEEVGRYWSPTEKKKVKEEFKLPPLPNAVEGSVATRFAPNPDFVLHLGSLRPLILSYEYAKMYKGRFYVRFEDTDPKTKKPEPEFYDAIKRDIEWLGIKPYKYVYQSDRLHLYYDVARCLIEKGMAYVCLCGREEFKDYVYSGRACPHRDQAVETNHELFDKMLSGYYGEGEAVLRIKTDLGHPNISVRDWPGLRIIDTSKYPHPRKGDRYIVWPLYNFSCAIDDHVMGITHVLRGAEHKVNEIKQEYIFRYMGWNIPEYIHHGRVAIPEGILSKSKILKGIREGIYTDIDDPRLATIAALRRRGYHPKALYNVILKTGVSLSNTTIDFSMLAAENKKIIDKDANRYYGVREPKNFNIYLESDVEVRIRLHPDFPDRGYRIFHMKRGVNKVFIDFDDIHNLTLGKSVRLIGLGNFIVSDDGLRFLNNDVSWAKENGLPFIHWIPSGYIYKAEFLYPGKLYRGYVERGLEEVDVDRVVQLERLGYFRIDYKDGYIRVVFAHK